MKAHSRLDEQEQMQATAHIRASIMHFMSRDSCFIADVILERTGLGTVAWWEFEDLPKTQAAMKRANKAWRVFQKIVETAMISEVGRIHQEKRDAAKGLPDAPHHD